MPYRLAVVLALGLFLTAGADPAPGLFFPDGQIRSRTVRVFVRTNLTLQNQPVLYLYPGSVVRAVPPWMTNGSLRPFDIIPNQVLDPQPADRAGQGSGSLLLFNLKQTDFTWPVGKASSRVDPVLSWDAGAGKAAAGRPVYLGDQLVAVIYAGVSMLVLVAVFVWLAFHAHGGGPNTLLIGDDGHLSLARVQVGAWTVFSGFAILCFSLMRYETPDIPPSLVVLMGMSLATGGISYFYDQKKDPAPPAFAVTGPIWRWSDLICEPKPDGTGQQLSVSRAQMAFWTVLSLALFLIKTLLDGRLWPVPWELVALMGISQLGYVVPKAKA